VEATNEMKLFIESVSSKPVKQTYYPSINSGYLEYKIYPSTTQFEITRLNFATDEIILYQNTTLTGAIKVETVVGGTITNQATMDIKAKASWNYGLGVSSETPPQLTDVTFPVSQIYTHAGSLGRYAKSMKLYYYYPKELTFISASDSNYTLDENQGLVMFTVNNIYIGELYRHMVLSSSGVSPGTYTATMSKLEVERYDGSITTVT
jgi:hypothetical protein